MSSDDPKRVLLCEPYFSGSHRSWAEGVARHSRHDVALLTHFGGFWKWRMQGAALTMANDIKAWVNENGPPDALLVSDMIDLPALLGLARDAIAGVPVLLYMHENQLTYPPRPGEAPDQTYGMINWLSMSAADCVMFNSGYHRDVVFERLPKFLGQFPDHRHGPEIAAVRSRSTVLPVGIDADRFSGVRSTNDVPVVLWNHRWEYDKDPVAFFAALEAIAELGVNFEVIVAGESYQTIPPEFEAGRKMLGDRVQHFAMATEDEYPDLLRQADIVVSTAHHEFFGVAVVEAITAGAFPLLPNHLSYPELVPTEQPYLYNGHDELVERLTWALAHGHDRQAAALLAAKYVEQFAWPVVIERYDTLLTQACR